MCNSVLNTEQVDFPTTLIMYGAKMKFLHLKKLYPLSGSVPKPRIYVALSKMLREIKLFISNVLSMILISESAVAKHLYLHGHP